MNEPSVSIAVTITHNTYEDLMSIARKSPLEDLERLKDNLMNQLQEAILVGDGIVTSTLTYITFLSALMHEIEVDEDGWTFRFNLSNSQPPPDIWTELGEMFSEDD